MRVKGRRIAFKGRLFNVRVDLTDVDGMQRELEIVEHRGSVVILPIIDDKILMVKQFRYPVNEELIELPAGTIEVGEDAKACAFRELIEETGFKPGKLVELGSFYSSPGYSTEKLTVFLATQLTRVGGVREEGIETIELGVGEVMEMIARREIRDSKTLAALMLYLSKVKLKPLS